MSSSPATDATNLGAAFICLQLQGTGVAISVGYPPDTDTPGYANENETKPDICKAVNAALGSELYSASKVGRRQGVGQRPGCACWQGSATLGLSGFDWVAGVTGLGSGLQGRQAVLTQAHATALPAGPTHAPAMALL